MSAFTDRLATIVQEQYSRWDYGQGRETWGEDQGHAKDYYLFVKDYWQSIGKSLDGRTIVKGIRPAWSAAFVSYCVRQAGAGDRFRYAEAHCHYIDMAMKAADGSVQGYGYVARRFNQYKPKPGDIVTAGREYASKYDYDKAKIQYYSDSFYPSHGDIVVAVADGKATVIGGNVNNSVTTKTLALDTRGFLLRRTDKGGNPLPWIAVLECAI